MGTREKDELIIAKILSVPETLGRRIASGNGFNARLETHGPSCAVGAGVLYAGLEVRNSDDTLDLFAKAHNVSLTYAAGVSDGFETDADGRITCVTFGDGKDKNSVAYQRGFAVGSAVRAASESK